MKLTFRPFVSAIALSATAVCATFPGPTSEGRTIQQGASRSTLTTEQLQRTPSLTAFEALQTMASYLGRATQQPPPQFVLMIDGARAPDLDVLKGLQARDLYEIRIISPTQSTTSGGAVEIIVTTIGRHRVVP